MVSDGIYKNRPGWLDPIQSWGIENPSKEIVR